MSNLDNPIPDASGMDMPPLSDHAVPPDYSAGSITDITQLASEFSARTGGDLPPQVSAELALEIMLNEVVEQACLATSATGAAVALQVGGEMVCLATSGTTAPPLGAHLDPASGISGECIKTKRAQRCDDAQFAPSADIEALQLMGVGSVLLYPILHGGDLVGVLELSSPRVSAFGERDERTLEALAHRVVKNLIPSDKPLAAPSEAPVPEPVVPKPELPALEDFYPVFQGNRTPQVSENPVPQVTSEKRLHFGIDAFTWALGAAVLACAVLLGGLVGRHLGWQQAQVFDSRAGTASVPALSTKRGLPLQAIAVSEKNQANSSVSTSASTEAAPPSGGLLVYENGKEVFRMAPASGDSKPVTSKEMASATPASLITPERPGKKSGEGSGALIRRVEPNYPEEALLQRIQGPVVLDVRIAPDGAVQDLKLVSGPPLLAQAATDAVMQWKFKPKAVKGRPVEMQTRVTLNFRLPRG
jgi:TonB family protein